MIGGVETHLRTRAGESALDACVRVILRTAWPEAVVEDAVTGRVFRRYIEVPFGGLSELFVYRDAATAERWDEEGAAPGLEDTMIHLIYSGDTMTVVVDEPDRPPMSEVLTSLRRTLGLDIFNFRAVARAA